MLTARTKTIERTGTGRQFPPSLASLSATKFSLQIYMELTDPTREFAFNKLHNVENQAQPSTCMQGGAIGAVKSHDFREFWLMYWNQHTLPEASSKIRSTRSQQNLGDVICNSTKNMK